MDTLKMHGEYHIEAVKDGKVVKTWDFKNLLTGVSVTMRGAALIGTIGNNYQIKYFAFGTGTTPATTADTQLENEQFRKQVTDLSWPDIPPYNTVISTCSLGSTDANFNIKEIGVFVGPNATGAENSGTLFSRVNVDIDKNSSITLNIVRRDICTIN